MHRSFSSKWLKGALNIAEHPRPLELPLFLYPSIYRALPRRRIRAVAFSSQPQTSTWKVQHRCLHAQAAAEDHSSEYDTQQSSPTQNQPNVRQLPRQCPGCGALSQITLPGYAGYFDLNRKSVIEYLQPKGVSLSRQEDIIYERALDGSRLEELKERGVDVDALLESVPPPEMDRREPQKKPVCERCHNLQHYSTGESIFHPSIDSIRDTIAESPHKHNHIYHVIDAADFPMSLLPRISDLLDTTPLRTKNRRSRSENFYTSWKTGLTFVINRCDLLAPQQEQVEKLFPYLQEVLRDALGRAGRNVRLGNLIAVSSRQNWRTRNLKEEIYKRGGGTWLVGKANVGKSKLASEVFPMGRMHKFPGKVIAGEKATSTERTRFDLEPARDDTSAQVIEGLEENIDEYSLLPPAPKETDYPDLPLVSALPGTTASPIRLPFGNGRGELIDLPGLERTGLEQHVQKSYRSSLILKRRVVPKQITITAGRSLLLGGFIRITPRAPAPVMLMCSFTPLYPHATKTDKAEAIQEQRAKMSNLPFDNIAEPGTGERTRLAGSFELKWDVTKQRTGPLMRKGAVGLNIEQLPFRVLSTDILIEGVGWVEIVAQVRTKDLFARKPKSEESPMEAPEEEKKLSAWERLEALAEDPKKRKTPPPSPVSGEPNWPIVDVYSPDGKYISCRRPMNGWMLNKPLESKAFKRSRPRKGMKGVKKLEKKRRREAALQ
ncbi:uncharacterized protein F4807DRAFT_422023 [Annulohypoxylon truncatum]|uniref:uncharacterized protein n=1 Tax=Annulohypoxylon truncatum TaxID=327061 RepID=UPI002008143B|nr:uncharacterized protein F4807DRAFT_422023 [Annulohypoxylon truncatum]KAI1210612.1 hypothetical protein F4807DRAFT_422023 [Annulohypoxylon truncatum]